MSVRNFAAAARSGMAPWILTLAMAFLGLTASAVASPISGGVGAGGTESSNASDGGGNAIPSRYDRLWERVTPAERHWAAKTSYCESGRDPDALGMNGQYRGAFMFTWNAWKTSPKTPGGDPIDYSYRTQAVVAVALMRELGTGPWPVCG